MSTHPNVILMAVLTPDDLSRKTMREIYADNGIENPELQDIVIGDDEYDHMVMETDYDDGFQISAEEGDLVFFDMVTYGYGEKIAWDKLEAQKKELEAWAKKTSNKFHCNYQIFVTANYW